MVQVARCTKIINPNTDDAKYVINIRQMAKYVVGLGERVSPTDIEEGMRVVRCVDNLVYIALNLLHLIGSGSHQVSDSDSSSS